MGKKAQPPARQYGELSRDLADKLRRAIASGEIPVGAKLPSNRELAARSNVSTVTARMAVLRLSREGILEIRKNTGTYVKSLPLATIPWARRTPQRLGVILSPWDTEQTPAWDSKSSLSEILRYVSRNECQVMIFSYPQWRKLADQKPDDMIVQNNLDTLVWFYTGPQDVRFILELERLNFRQLILNRRTFGIRAAAILHDEEAMAGDIVGRMTENERRNLLILSASRDIQPYAERMDALQKQLEQYGCYNPDSVLILPEAKRTGCFPRWTRSVLESELLRLRPRVVVDFTGYINPLSKIPDSFYEQLAHPRFISIAPPSAWECRRDFHYTCYNPGQQSVNRMIRRFLETDTWDKTVRLPYIRKEV